MKNVYRIKNQRGITLCFQVAKSESEAVETAKVYGFRTARLAEFVRED